MPDYQKLSHQEIKTIRKKKHQNLRKEAVSFVESLNLPVTLEVKEAAIKTVVDVSNICTTFHVQRDDEKLKEILLEGAKQKTLPGNLRAYKRKLYNDSHKHKEFLETVIEKGMKMRHKLGDKPFPEFFEGHPTVYLKIPPVEPAGGFLLPILDEMNAILEKNGNKVKIPSGIDETSLSLEFNGQRIKPVKFFAGAAQDLLKIDPAAIDGSDSVLFDIFKSGDFAALKQEVRSRRQNPDGSFNKNYQNAALCSVFEKNELVFSNVAARLQGKDNWGEMADILPSLSESYSKTASKLEYEVSRSSVKGSDLLDAGRDSIDMIIISSSPVLVSRMATYQDWASCMNAGRTVSYNDREDGEKRYYADYLPADVGYGTLIAYGVNSKDPEKKVCRALLKPFLGPNGQRIYHVNKTFGAKLPEFQEALRNVTDKELNPENIVGAFYLPSRVYADGAPEEGKQYYSKDIKTFEKTLDFLGIVHDGENGRIVFTDDEPLKFPVLPEGISFPDSIDIKYAKETEMKAANFQSFTKELSVANRFMLRDYPLAELPGKMKVHDFTLKNAPHLTSLPENFSAKTADLNNCPSLERIPASALIATKLRIDEAPLFVSLPDGLNVVNLELSGCRSFEKLPKGITASYVNLNFLPKLTELPEDMNVGGAITIGRGMDGLRSIPPSIPNEKINGLPPEKIEEFKQNWIKDHPAQTPSAARIVSAVKTGGR